MSYVIFMCSNLSLLSRKAQNWNKVRIIFAHITDFDSMSSINYVLHIIMLHYCIDPGGRPQSRPVVITIFTHVVRPSVRPAGRHKTSKSSDNHCRAGLWAGQVDHCWLLSCCYIIINNTSILLSKLTNCDRIFVHTETFVIYIWHMEVCTMNYLSWTTAHNCWFAFFVMTRFWVALMKYS